MITMVIDNSTCQLQGLTLGQLKALRNLLSYSLNSQAAYFSSSYNTKRYLMDKRGSFPSGLIAYAAEYLRTARQPYQVSDRRRPPEPRRGLFTLSLGLPPYREQIEAVKACKASRGAVCMPTGFGKSVTMALLVNELQMRTLIIVPNLSLKRQLTESFMEYFGSLDNITIENIDSTALQSAADYDVLIIDEAHHVAARTYRDLNRKVWTGIYRRYFFTATPFRSRDEEQLLYESIAGQVIYRVEHKDAVAAGRIVPVEAYYYELPKKEILGNEMSWPSVYSELVVNNEYRNRLIALILCRLNAQGKAALCLVKEIRHGESIEDLTGLNFANGMADNTGALIEDFNLGEIKSLIGTTGVLGEGVDTKPAEFIIIAGLGKSKNSIMQQVGRGFRVYHDKESCKVILFKDKSHKFTLRHFKAQCKILREEYGIVPSKLELPEGI